MLAAKKLLLFYRDYPSPPDRPEKIISLREMLRAVLEATAGRIQSAGLETGDRPKLTLYLSYALIGIKIQETESSSNQADSSFKAATAINNCRQTSVWSNLAKLQLV